MPRPRTHDENLRLKLLDRAGELISADGPKALSLRKLAADVGTSTTAVYSLFGGKTDLVSALFSEGFRRFGLRMSGVSRTGDPVEDLVRLGVAYRESALADPHLYAIMFTRSVPGFEPAEEMSEQARATLAPLEETIREAVADGVFAEVPPEVVIVSCWGLVHGLVSLELNGNLPEEFTVSEAYETALRANASGWLRR
ncbi:TetR/AcrR family transcriptional regulator [Amycolatopsis regifaucium]|uniref:TetR family transcriptional regulator n=1 Tax=Amycolatopsis regifaucium TaxID=546365 RepID=A0A154MCK5_9PSEU|nr:TetR/AcrR family transcriptional regulator [Amycolatopsis regifaucium]KZB82226.1 TetR family transcriptional regulator [Amycolatopsis regifaucium]OKA05705.1 TetR family transcriptional regulator [Amycolatopsis regifaucium]SFG86711.1 DNA-binding transcriptional regulator, AcrR family [Amycolatopsis regifaucium]